MNRPVPRRRPAAPRRPRARPWWLRLSDEELLDLRFCDLGLELDGSRLEPYIDRLYAELEARGLSCRPHCWIAAEWFSPDGVPGIAVPFYLLHPRLMRLERRMMHEVEGGNANWLMRILRHEAGHAIDTAYRLRRRRAWREIFGPASLPYPRSYRPRPGSRRFVQHLGEWYAQSHPTEDFAETFAVWLRPRSRWRREYAGWPALAKLACVDRLMTEVRGEPPPVRSRLRIESLADDRRTLREHYREKTRRYRSVGHAAVDASLQRICGPAGDAAPRVAVLLRSLRRGLHARAAAATGASGYEVHQALREVIGRCDELALTVRGRRERAALRLQRLLTRLISGRHRGTGPRLPKLPV
jgi:hypothetical protein